MKQIRLEDAFTPVPSMVHARVEQSLKEVRAMNMKHKKPVFAFALAAILLLALMCAAVAATQRGVLSYLFGGWEEEPTPEQQQMVQDIGEAERTEDFTVTATDALFDGRKLDVGLLYTVGRETYVMLEGVWFNGERVEDDTAGEMDRWLTPQEEPIASGVSILGDRRLSGTVEVRLRLMLLTPNKGLQKIAFDRMTEDECDAAFYAAVQEGYTPVDSDSLGRYLPTDAYARQAARQAGEDEGFRYSLAWAEEANMTAREVNLTFSVESSAGESDGSVRLYYQEKEDAPWEIVVETAELTPTSSHFVIDVYPRDGGMSWEEVRTFWLKHPYGFYAANGEKLAFQSAGSHYGQGDPRQGADGQWYWRIDQEKPALLEMTDMVLLVPETVEGEPCWEYAIRLERISAEDLNG